MNAVLLSAAGLGEVVPEGEYLGRLMRPNDKIVGRFVRQAVKEVAQATKSHYDVVESAFQRARHEMTHLIKHDRYPDEIRRLMGELKRLHGLLMASRHQLGAPRLDYPKVQAAFDRLVKEFDKCEMFFALTKQDVATFVKVADRARAIARNESYDPEHIVPVDHYRLATMMAANFEAYRLTLE